MVVCSALAYGQYSAPALGSTQRLDLFLPKGPGPFPVIVWVHGGAWTTGNRGLSDDWPGLARQLARGYAVASIDYRLASTSTGIRFPTPLYDVKQAVRWLKWAAPRYRLQGARMALWGHSAGAHLAALAGGTTAVGALEPPFASFGPAYWLLVFYSSSVRLVIGYGGVYDLGANLAWNPPATDGGVDGASTLLACDLPGGSVMALPACTSAVRQAASPMRYLGGPPVGLAHGDDDPVANLSQPQGFKTARDRAGLLTGLQVVPGGGHGYDRALWLDGLAPSLDYVLDTYVRNAA